MIINKRISFSRPWMYPDWIYYITPRGREFTKLCDYVHKFADEIIKSRRETLVSSKNLSKFLLTFDILLVMDNDIK